MAMQVTQTDLPGVLILEPTVFGDDRGFFFETYNAREFAALTGTHAFFVQDNHSYSKRNVVRGLHYQIRQAQGKLVRVVKGEMFDVTVDMRRSSPTFGRWAGVHLSAANRRHLWIPPGYAHGFLALSDGVGVLYKVTDYWAPEHERCVIWNDSKLGIDWPLQGAPVLSPRDVQGVAFSAAELFD